MDARTRWFVPVAAVPGLGPAVLVLCNLESQRPPRRDACSEVLAHRCSTLGSKPESGDFTSGNGGLSRRNTRRCFKARGSSCGARSNSRQSPAQGRDLYGRQRGLRGEQAAGRLPGTKRPYRSSRNSTRAARSERADSIRSFLKNRPSGWAHGYARTVRRRCRTAPSCCGPDPGELLKFIVSGYRG